MQGSDHGVRHGDCLTGMAALDADSVDAIVTDPPYGLGFMGKDWDHGIPGPAFWQEALRAAKPGAHLLAFGGTRTFHRLAVAIEDAGWEIRDCLSWLYGSGFPKSHNGPWGGTALKPAWEPILLARKPLAGTVAANVTQHGTGGLNIDGCRIEGENPSIARRAGSVGHLSDRPARETEAEGRIASRTSPERYREERPGELLGRWPANVCLDEDAAAILDAQSGERRSPADYSRSAPRPIGYTGSASGRLSDAGNGYGDTGGASRFFYCAKASRSEREAGLGDLKASHPTVKPLALMRWLCRLVTPPGGLVLDPFTGSGTTGCAATLEGFRFLGFEQEAEYVEIARRRIAHHVPIQPELSA